VVRDRDDHDLPVVEAVENAVGEAAESESMVTMIDPPPARGCLDDEIR